MSCASGGSCAEEIGGPQGASRKRGGEQPLENPRLRARCLALWAVQSLLRGSPAAARGVQRRADRQRRVDEGGRRGVRADPRRLVPRRRRTAPTLEPPARRRSSPASPATASPRSCGRTSSSRCSTWAISQEAAVQLARLDGVAAGSTSDLAEIARAKLLRLQGQPGRRVRAGPRAGRQAGRSRLARDPAARRSRSRRSARSATTRPSRTWMPGSGTRARRTTTPCRDEVTAALAKEPDSVLQNALRAMRCRRRVGLRARDPADHHRAPRRGRARAQRLRPRALARVGRVERAAPRDRGGGARRARHDEARARPTSTAARSASSSPRARPTCATRRPRSCAASRGRSTSRATTPRKGDRTKLATRDDGGDANRVEPTMTELAGEGAAVILAALDPASADRAVQLGREEQRRGDHARRAGPGRRRGAARLGVRRGACRATRRSPRSPRSSCRARS